MKSTIKIVKKVFLKPRENVKRKIGIFCMLMLIFATMLGPNMTWASNGIQNEIALELVQDDIEAETTIRLEQAKEYNQLHNFTDSNPTDLNPDLTNLIEFDSLSSIVIEEINTDISSFYMEERSVKEDENGNTRALPDLVVSSLTCVPSLPTVGVPVTFQFQISNIGNATASGVFYTDIRVDGALLATIQLSNLPAGYTGTGSFDITFPVKKTYLISMKADCNNNITESDENNNTKTLSLTNLRISPTITISGTLVYKVYQHVGSSVQYEYLKNYTILICDNSNNQLKATVTTNSSGFFSTTITNNTANDGCDVFFRILMNDNSYATITPTNAFVPYAISSQVLTKYQSPTLDYGTVTIEGSDTIEGVMNIYHWIKKGKDFYTSTASMGSAGVVTIRWDPTSTPGSFQSSDTITLDGGNSADQYDADIILHEYGHYIQRYNNRMPLLAGGTHYWNQPSLGILYIGTAYTEAYGHFISTQVRGSQTVYDYNKTTPYFGGNLNTRKYTENGSTNEVKRQSIFFHNARMELFTGGAMYNLSSLYGFNRVNNVVMSATLDSSIEFYDAFIAGSSSKSSDWTKLNNYHSAFDYTLPSISITKSGDTFYATASDNIGISRIEWYFDNVYYGTGNSFAIPPNLQPGSHVVEARAYDQEGAERNYWVRENVYGLITLRTDAYKSATQSFSTRSGQSDPEGFAESVLLLVPDRLPEHNFVSDDIFILSNIGIDSSLPYATGEKTQIIDENRNDLISVKNDTISVGEDVNLYITGNVFGAYGSIDVIDDLGRIATSVDSHISPYEYEVVSDLSPGDYTLSINKKGFNEDIEIPYRIVTFVVPKKPELELPEYSSEISIEINNLYSKMLIIESGGKE